MLTIDSIIFWLGGVIAPPLWQLTNLALTRLGCKTDSELHFAFVDLSRHLATGSITDCEYCDEVIRRSACRATAAQLALAIGRSANLFPGIFPLLEELMDSYQLYLLTDYPERWLSPLLSNTPLSRCFGDPATVLPAANYHVKSILDLPAALVRSGVVDNKSTLLIDADPLRAMISTRAGLYAPIFVNSWRLRREFTLWGLLSS